MAVGPRTHSWGFWNLVTGEFVPWREFLAAKRIKAERGAQQAEGAEPVVEHAHGGSR